MRTGFRFAWSRCRRVEGAGREDNEERAGASRQSNAAQWYLVGVLTLAYMLKFIDSAVLTVTLNPIKLSLGITDVQMSVLVGFAFVSLYALLSLPAGYIADIVSRRVIVGLAVLTWSGAQVLCGLSTGYWSFFAARVGLGICEAALPPAAYSLLRDGVAARRRGRAFGIYQSALTLGGGVGALGGGALFAAASAGAFRGVPLIGHLRSWQVVVAAPGLLGVLLSPLLLTVREPPRTGLRTASIGGASIAEAARYIAVNRRTYAPIFGAVIAVSMAGGGAWNAWLIPALGRVWPLSTAEIGRTAGLLQLGLFPLSIFCVGYLMDYYGKRGLPGAPLRVALVLCLINVVPSLALLLAPSVKAMWVAYALCTIFGTSATQIACGVMLANVTPLHLMGKVVAIYFLSANILGQAVGVSCIAMVAEYAWSGPGALSHALLLCYVVAMAFMLLMLLWGAKTIKLSAAANTS